jgi:hypothetical protein
MRVCARCSNIASRADARFCVHCGWPLVQACPYPACGQEVALLAEDGRPTRRCPVCKRPLKACADPHCRRLHTYAAERCLNEHGHPLMVADPDWVHEAGTPARTFSIGMPDPVVGAAQLNSTPDYRADIQAMVSVAGEVVFVVGGMMHTWQPGSATTDPTPLGETLPPGPWRLLSVGGSFFVVGAGQVQIFPFGGSSAIGRFPGRFFSQTSLGRRWVGLRAAERGCEVEFRDEAGTLIACHWLDARAEDSLPIVGGPNAVWVATTDGRIWKIDEHGASETSGPEVGSVSYAAFGRGFVRVGQKEGKTFVSQGDLIQPVEGLVAPSCPPMIDREGQVWVVGGSPSEAYVLNPYTLSVVNRIPLLVQHAAAAILLEGTSATMAVVGLDANRRTVRLIAMPAGGQIAEPYQTGPSAALLLASGDGMLHVGVRFMGDHRVRSYKLGA